VTFSRKQRAFLASFAVCGRITTAAKAARIDRSQHYEWLEKADYQQAFKEAGEKAADALEDEARRRAEEGMIEAVYYQGKPIGARRTYSDGLTMFLLRGLRPNKYRERRDVELSGPNGGPIEQELLVRFVEPGK
jgi:hypothetical protein